MPDIEQFAEQLKEEVLDQIEGIPGSCVRETAADDTEMAFVEAVAARMLEFGALEDADFCYLSSLTGAGWIKCNGYWVDEEQGRADLLVALYDPGDWLANAGKVNVRQTLVRAIRFFRQAVKGNLDGLAAGSDQHAMLRRILEAKDSIQQVRVVLLTNGIIQDGSLDEGPTHEGYAFHYELWDMRRLFRCCVSGLPYEAITVDFEDMLGAPLPCIEMPECDADYTVYMTILPGPVVHRLYDEYGGKLLELNVRSFLQVRGKVNRGIRSTIKEEPARFLAYNNGISATAERVETVRTDEGGLAIRAMHGLQVVNGGQTVASIHNAKEKDKADISQIHVQAKITTVVPGLIEDLVPKISRYANTQNRVSEADFSSNDPFHVEIERLSESTWAPGEQSRWFYERARGQYQVAKSRIGTTPARKRRFTQDTPPSQKFTKTDLARFVGSWDMLPHVVSRGAQKNFVDFMARLRRSRGREWNPDQDYYKQLIAKAIIYRRTEKMARQLQLPAYRANAVTYTVAYLCHRTVGRVDLDAIWMLQDISTALESTLLAWLPIIHAELVSSAGNRNVTEWCKKEDCWRHIQTLALERSPEFEHELAEGQPLPTVGSRRSKDGSGLSEADRENIAKVMLIDAADWIAVHGWGARTGILNPKQAGIALTLGGYASAGWQQVPSGKQAWHGVKVVELAREEGILAANGSGGDC